MRERRRQPQADLISALTRVEEQGDVLSEEDLIGLCDQLLTAGHDTTRNLIGNGILALLQNQDQLQKLWEDPGLIISAVESYCATTVHCSARRELRKRILNWRESTYVKDSRYCRC